MSLKYLSPALVSLAACLVLIWGCQAAKPLGPIKNVAMNVYVPQTAELKASLLGVAQNELLYRVDGPGLGASYKGTVGPFSTASNFGSVDFLLNIPSNAAVLSLQLNDASTHQPLAIGAVGLTGLASPVSDLVVEMGSVTRNCYTLNVPGGDSGETYEFATDNLPASIVSGGGMDIQMNYYAGFNYPLTITTAQGATGPIPDIAYLGNGDFVDYDFVPSAPQFFNNSFLAKGAPVTIGDIFCISLSTGGHAWFQVTALGNGTLYAGPKFRYRINSISTYYGYEQTVPDIANTCSTLW